VHQHQYQRPDGRIVDKRTWKPGTLVAATLNSGARLETVTGGVPRQWATGTWGVRLRGLAYPLALERVDPREQASLLGEGLERTNGSEKFTSTRGEGNRGG
jgi:hypothetical protein